MNPISDVNNNNSIKDTNYRLEKDIQVPLEYIDPVTMEIMKNPVVVSPSGNTYDKTTIDKIFDEDIIPKDPLSKAKIQGTVANRALKTNIERFLDANPILKETEEEVQIEQKKEVVKLTENQFMQLFADKDEVTFKEKTEYQIINVSRKKAFRILQEGSMELVLDLLSDVLMPIGKRVISIAKDSKLNTGVSNGDLATFNFTMNVDTQWSIIAKISTIKARISHLYDRLYRGHLEIISFEPNQEFIMLLSKRDTDYLVKPNQTALATRLNEIFAVKLPKEFSGIRVNLGECNIVDKSMGLEHSISLTGKAGMSIRLIRSET